MPPPLFFYGYNRVNNRELYTRPDPYSLSVYPTRGCGYGSGIPAGTGIPADPYNKLLNLKMSDYTRHSETDVNYLMKCARPSNVVLV